MKTLTAQSIPSVVDKPILTQDVPPEASVQIQSILPGITRLPADALQEDAYLIQAMPQPTPTWRMVVLVPPEEFDENALARRVWKLAAVCGLSVLYLTICDEGALTAYQRRRLAILAAVTADHQVQAHARVIAEKSWRLALDQTLRPGDVLVCLRSQPVPASFFRRRSLGMQLAEWVNAPVYMLGGFKVSQRQPFGQRITGLKAWSASFALIAVFFGLQVGLDRLAIEPGGTILLCLTVLVEAYLLWKLNEWMR